MLNAMVDAYPRFSKYVLNSNLSQCSMTKGWFITDVTVTSF